MSATSDIQTSSVGVGFKASHFRDVISAKQGIGFFEVHAENYMGAGGPPLAQLERLCEDYRISVHGVGLSIGGAEALDEAHLNRLKVVVDRFQPALFSEHLAWSTHQGRYYNDLLALPYNAETLQIVCDHVDQVQMYIGRQMLLENPSSYIAFSETTMDEVDFISEVQRRTGCGLLLDVNNVYVSAVNMGIDAIDYIDRFQIDAVQEIHIAGHAEAMGENGERYLIDAHNGAVADPVMELLSYTVQKTGSVPVLLEWDNEVPEWNTLSGEAEKISRALRAPLSDGGLEDVA